MADDLIYTQPVLTERGNGHAVAVHVNAGSERVRYATEYENDDTSEDAHLNLWLKANLLCERDAIIENVAQAFAECDDQVDRLKDKIDKLERTVERLSGAIDVLRTGKVLRPCGLYNADRQYQQLDIVALGGSSFIAIEDRPGECPGDGWRLLASCGSRGQRGRTGPQGKRGEPGLSPVATGIKGMHVNPQTYVLTILTSDRKLHQLSLKPLFQAFLNQVTRGNG